MRAIAIFASLFAAFLASPAVAQEEDFNIWGGQFIFVDLDKDGDVFIRAEAQERFMQDADRLGQLLLRSFIGKRVNDSVTIGGGYAYIFTDPVGPAEINEHRIYQEATVKLFDNGQGLSVTSRNRLEQRFYEESSSTGWRYRNQVQLRAPISNNNNLVIYTEPFIGLNDVAFNDGGIAIWRNFVGVSIPLTEGISMTPGYLNQYVFRDDQEDLTQHIVNVGITARF